MSLACGVPFLIFPEDRKYASGNWEQVPVFPRLSLSLQKIGFGSAIFENKFSQLPSLFPIFVREEFPFE